MCENIARNNLRLGEALHDIYTFIGVVPFFRNVPNTKTDEHTKNFNTKSLMFGWINTKTDEHKKRMRTNLFGREAV